MIRNGSIAWHVKKILSENKQPMHWQDILSKLEKRKKLIGDTPGATLLSILLRNKDIFKKPKRGWYKLK